MDVTATATGPLERKKSLCGKIISELFSFYWLHFSFYLFGSFIAGTIVYFIEMGNPLQTLSFLDAWFFGMSALTNTGLLPFDLSLATVGTQVVMAILFQAGRSARKSIFFANSFHYLGAHFHISTVWQCGLFSR